MYLEIVRLAGGHHTADEAQHKGAASDQSCIMSFVQWRSHVDNRTSVEGL